MRMHGFALGRGSTHLSLLVLNFRLKKTHLLLSTVCVRMITGTVEPSFICGPLLHVMASLLGCSRNPTIDEFALHKNEEKKSHRTDVGIENAITRLMNGRWNMNMHAIMCAMNIQWSLGIEPTLTIASPIGIVIDSLQCKTEFRQSVSRVRFGRPANK